MTTPISYVQAYFQYDSKKEPAVSPSATCASVITRSVLLTMSWRTLLHATFLHTSSRLRRWSATCPMVLSGQLRVGCRKVCTPPASRGKRYIAKNNINVCLINALSLAKEIGMGSPHQLLFFSPSFFALAKVLQRQTHFSMKDAAALTLTCEERPGKSI